MKKEGIQTRNRKLSSKGKKKKNSSSMLVGPTGHQLNAMNALMHGMGANNLSSPGVGHHHGQSGQHAGHGQQQHPLHTHPHHAHQPSLISMSDISKPFSDPNSTSGKFGSSFGGGNSSLNSMSAMSAVNHYMHHAAAAAGGVAAAAATQGATMNMNMSVNMNMNMGISAMTTPAAFMAASAAAHHHHHHHHMGGGSGTPGAVGGHPTLSSTGAMLGTAASGINSMVGAMA